MNTNIKMKVIDGVIVIEGKDGIAFDIHPDGSFSFGKDETTFDVGLDNAGELNLDGFNIHNLKSYAVKAERAKILS